MDDLSVIFGTKGKFKILKTLLEEEETNISSLLREVRISYPLAIKYLSELEKEGLIKQKRFGRIRIISLENNRSTRILKNFLIEWKNSKEERVGKGFG
jgi:DNA-binding HxlR family transcriptional regulator